MAQPNLRSLGLLKPDTTNVSVVSSASSATNTDLVGQRTWIHEIYFQADKDNDGTITISDRAGYPICVLNVPAATGPLPDFNYDSPHGVLNGLVLDDFLVKGSDADQQVLVTFQIF